MCFAVLCCVFVLCFFLVWVLCFGVFSVSVFFVWNLVVLRFFALCGLLFGCLLFVYGLFLFALLVSYFSVVCVCGFGWVLLFLILF